MDLVVLGLAQHRLLQDLDLLLVKGPVLVVQRHEAEVEAELSGLRTGLGPVAGLCDPVPAGGQVAGPG